MYELTSLIFIYVAGGGEGSSENDDELLDSESDGEE